MSYIASYGASRVTEELNMAHLQTAYLAPEPSADTWRDHSACRGASPDVFHPPEGDEGLRAKMVCDACVVKTACLEFAIETREKDGVWGGLTATERRRLVRRRRRQAAAKRDSAA